MGDDLDKKPEFTPHSQLHIDYLNRISKKHIEILQRINALHERVFGVGRESQSRAENPTHSEGFLGHTLQLTMDLQQQADAISDILLGLEEFI